MKKYVKIIIFIILIVICLFSSVYAYTPSFTPDKLTGTGGKTDEIEKAGAGVLTYISVIASAISIIAMILLGIKYMLGSVEEKAEYKKTLIPYLIGAICVFGATTIPAIVYNIFN